jgi:hypothetical protein
MEDNKTNVELEEESLEMVDENSIMNPDELQKFFEDQLSKMRSQGMTIGVQTVCSVILQKIVTHMTKPGKKSYRDLERLIAEIKQFCETGMSRKVDAEENAES